MATKSGGRKRLGRGLSSLIQPSEDAGVGDAAGRDYALCPIDAIDAFPNQPRTYFDEARLEELADSIREAGVLQPIVVRRAGGDRYQLIAGERRLRAARRAGLREIPAVIRDVQAKEAFALALVENVQREDLNPIEEAEAYRQLIDEFGMTQAEVAKQIGKSRSAIANALRLLRLDDGVQSFVIDGRLSAGHARAVLSVDEDERATLAQRIVEEEMSVRTAEETARALNEPPAPESDEAEAPTRASARDTKSGGERAHTGAKRPALRDAERRMRERLGTRVEIKERGEHGTVEIHYADQEALRGIVDAILGLEGS